MKLAHKVALITGAASGLGLSTAKLFAAEGAHVALLDLNVDRLDRAKRDLERSDLSKCLCVAGDVSSESFVRTAVAEVASHFGCIDILFNNAAVDPVSAGGIVDTSAEMWDRIMDVNVKAAFMLCKYCLPLMTKRGGGVIINTGSSAGIKPTVGQAAYSVSKAAIIALTRSLAAEFSSMNIRANCLCPGFLESVMSDRLPDLTAEQLEDRTRHVKGRVPMGREGRYSEAARVVLFLATDDSSYITGAVVPVDGGWLIA